MPRCFPFRSIRPFDGISKLSVYSSSVSPDIEPCRAVIRRVSSPLRLIQLAQDRQRSSPPDTLDLFVSSVRRCEYSSSNKDAKHLHSGIAKSGFGSDVFMCNTLINGYARAEDMASAYKLFVEMPERNSVTWACLLSGYTRNGMPWDACRVFQELICRGSFPNVFAFASALQACKELNGGIRFGMQIHCLTFKFPSEDDTVLNNVLISMYGNCTRLLDHAYRAFEEITSKNSMSWNSIISVCSQRGYATSVFELFSSMQKDDSAIPCQPTEYTLGSLIAAAGFVTEYGLSMLEGILSRVTKSGFLSDLYVGSALVSSFSKFEGHEYAEDVMKQMPERNFVSVNGFMIGLVRQKRPEAAVEVFLEMSNLVDLNVDTFVILLTAISEFDNKREGRRKGQEVHSFTVRTGLIGVKAAIENGLINMYFKCGGTVDAKATFRIMKEKDVVSWNSMISGLDHNDCWEDAVENYIKMRQSGFIPSNFTLISSVSSCAALNWIELGQQIHAEGIKLGLDLDISVSNALLAMYAETGFLSLCQHLFSQMTEYDTVSWNTMIGACSEVFAVKSATFLREMMRGGWQPDNVTLINSLTAASCIPWSGLTHQIHTLAIKHHVADDTSVDNALFSCYGRCGRMDECEKIFNRMYHRRNESTWNSMISGYIHNEWLSKAMDLVWFMLQNNERIDSYTVATIVSACASVATLTRGMEVHGCAIRRNVESDVIVGSALLDMYAKCGRIDYASTLFCLMPNKNLYSWNSMISGYARHGCAAAALELFTQMKLHGHFPDGVTFVGVLSACSHAGLVDEGFEHFNSMSKLYNLAPAIQHYSCMVDLLGRAGQLQDMESFINGMPLEPNVHIWRAALSACSRAHARQNELGQKAAKMLLIMDPQHAANRILLSNMYASGGKWDQMAKIRSLMRSDLIKKEAGCSWVTMKDGMHIFVSGDRSHPERAEIYNKLRELSVKMKAAGYVPQTEFALYDMETENKEEALMYHSEKLALAFVLTRSSSLPIRIMKNLRVCGDCHLAFKCISKVVGRLIVLRDTNRFHHFKDGICSCGDYW